MARPRLLWHFYPLFLAVTLLTFFAASHYATRALRDFYHDNITSELRTRAVLASSLVTASFLREDPAAVENICRDIGDRTDMRLTIIEPSGHVLADSAHDPLTMDDHAGRPEIRAALRGEVATSERYSSTMGEYLMYAASPVRDGTSVVAVVRTSFSLTTVNETLRRLQLRMVLSALVIVALTWIAIAVLARRIQRPLADMKLGAQRFAAGDLAFRMPVPDYEELGGLAETLNRMAEQLNDRINTVNRQRNEQQAVLASMTEGVIAVDLQERVIQANRAASDLFGLGPDRAQGRVLAEVARNAELQRLVTQSLGSTETVEAEIVFYSGEEKYLQCRCTPLRDAREMVIGALIVLNDMTRLRRLERVRRDFVTNVSHELKTPLTSIKGFVETLLEGAVDQPEEARRFLAIMDKHVDRLQAILEDLLSLSRIEQESERGEIPLQPGDLSTVLSSAVQLCTPHADEKQIRVELRCDPSHRALINSALLEQAAVNLIENAIKYSDPGKTLRIHVEPEEGGWAIHFRDEGFGIGAEHLSRIFERFYRVDKSRSRKVGGTGLGLAIVKHIVTAHGGRVTVTSEPGAGSDFVIHLTQS